MTGIFDERLLFVSFGQVSEKRAQKTIEAFLKVVNSPLLGYPVRFDSIGRTPKFNSTQVILGVWYPTDDEVEAPISIDAVANRLEDFVRSASAWRSMDLYFGKADRTVMIYRGHLAVYDEVLQARDLYILQHHLLLDEAEVPS
jgi:hypothetical protein